MAVSPSRRSPAADRAPEGRVQRTLFRWMVHLTYIVSLVLGDDWLGRRVRSAVLRRAGATIAPSASLHGGTYMTDPRNLYVGRESFINRSCYLDLSGPLILGDNVNVGHGATFITVEHSYLPDERGTNTFRPIVLKEGSWVGANATVMPGVTIGRFAVVAAGALVLKDVPDGWVVGGVPARFLKAGADGAAAEKLAVLIDRKGPARSTAG